MRKFICLILMLIFLLQTDVKNLSAEKPIRGKKIKQEKSSVPELSQAEQQKLKDLSGSLNQLGFDLLNKSSKSENYFVSPAGISLAISLANTGAMDKTYEQIAKVLHYSSIKPEDKAALLSTVGMLNQQLSACKEADGFELSCANHLWADVRLQVNAGFQEFLKQHFAAKMTLLDFMKETEQARQSINMWAENNTAGRIKNLLAPGIIKPDTRMVLTNAVYFQAEWGNKFEKDSTRPGNFTLADGKVVQTPLMHDNSNYYYTENKDLQALKMFYQGGRMSMVVLLPQTGVELNTLQESLDAGKLQEINKKFAREKVVVTFPKFELETTLKLSNVLKELGMEIPFSDAANFSGISKSESLKIDEVVHKTFLKVYEEGTEAAAATAVIMMPTSAAPGVEVPPKIFKADHPFLLTIQDEKTGLILFIGKVMKP